MTEQIPGNATGGAGVWIIIKLGGDGSGKRRIGMVF